MYGGGSSRAPTARTRSWLGRDMGLSLSWVFIGARGAIPAAATSAGRASVGAERPKSQSELDEFDDVVVELEELLEEDELSELDEGVDLVELSELLVSPESEDDELPLPLDFFSVDLRASFL